MEAHVSRLCEEMLLNAHMFLSPVSYREGSKPELDLSPDSFSSDRV